MQLIDGFQVADATVNDDGSVTTTLYDTDGNNVGTVTRLPDGTSSANVEPLASDTGGFDWAATIKNVTNFLNQVAAAQRAAADTTTRVSRAITSGVAGAQAGYNAPIDWRPWAIAGGAILVVGLMVSNARPSRRR